MWIPPFAALSGYIQILPSTSDLCNDESDRLLQYIRQPPSEEGW